MGDYTKLGQVQLQQILGLYGLNELRAHRPLSLGISNSNYRIETEKGLFLLKVSNDKNIEQIQQEMGILYALYKKSFEYSITPIKTQYGHLVYEWDNLHGVLFPFVEGIPPGPSDMTCYEIGKGIATLHSLEWSDGEIASMRDHKQVGYPIDTIIKYTQNEKCPEDYKNTFYKLFPDGLSSYRATSFKKGLIHGDLYYDNTLFNNNHLNKILDFEQAGVDDLIFDLGICISGTCLEKGRLHPSLIESLLEGYNGIRPLPKEERAHLKEAILLGLYSIALWRIKRFKEGSLDQKLANSYQDLMNRANSFFEMEWS